MKNFFFYFFFVVPLHGERKLGRIAASLLRGIRLDQPKRIRMMKRTKSLLGVAGCVLAAGSLCAADYSESFESANTWTGDGTLFATNYPYSGVAGKPLSEANPNHVLVIEGESSYNASSGSYTGSPLVDMMVQAALPDDALETPEGNPHIAVAVDTNGIFNVYCKNKSDDDAGWHPLSNKKYEDGAWARVSLLFDYDNSLCQIRIDGEPMMTENGYLNTTKAENGAWYPLASTGSSVSNLKVVGCTAIDDVVIAANATGYAITSGAKTNGVSCAWLDQYGLAWDTTKTYDSSNMTVADKYKYCFSPFEGQTAADFEVKSMSTTASSVTVGVPATVDTAGRKVVLESATNEAFTEGKEETLVAPNTTTVVIERTPEPGKVLYFKLRATDVNGNN